MDEIAVDPKGVAKLLDGQSLAQGNVPDDRPQANASSVFIKRETNMMLLTIDLSH